MIEYSLEDVCLKVTDGAHFSPKAQALGYPMFSVKDMNEYGFNYDSCKYISEEDFIKLINQDCIPKKGDVLVAKDGSYLKQIFICEEEKKVGILSSIAIFRPNQEKIMPKYLMYLLKSPKVFNDVKNNYVSGSALPRIVLKDFKKVRFKIHSMREQEKIVSVLEDIDDKIRTNHKINNNLEQQAQAIFKSWFINFNPFGGFQPSDWQLGTVNDLAKEIVCGKTPSTKKEYYYGEDIPFITIPDMHNCVYALNTARSLSLSGAESQSKKTLPVNSVCVSCIGTAGLVTLVPVPSQTNQQINSIIPKDEISPYYVYLLMQTMSEIINKLGQSGSTIVNLNKVQFGKINVLIPSKKVMSDFTKNTEPIFEMILSNQRENNKLINLRDMLLPKLMSGELDVSNIDI